MTFFEKFVLGFLIVYCICIIPMMFMGFYKIYNSYDQDRIMLERSKEETKKMQAIVDAYKLRCKE